MSKISLMVVAETYAYSLEEITQMVRRFLSPLRPLC